MENKRWGLIFIGLYLALAFSVSPVAAQTFCEDSNETMFAWLKISSERCDRDGDCYVKNNKPCIRDNSGDPSGDPPPAGIDCDDSDPDLNTDCSGGDPEPDPEPTTKTPLIVTFDDLFTDSIQSDPLGGHDGTGKPSSLRPYVHDGEKEGITAVLDDGIFMILRQGGDERLFINFGPLVDCGNGERIENDDPPFGDCVLDIIGPDPHLRDEIPFVECPFPLRDPDGELFRTPPGSPPGSCSALVQAALTEHDVFNADDGPDPEVLDHVQDMDPTPAEGNIKVRPFQEWDIEFTLRRSAKGAKRDGLRIAFSAKQENCSLAALDLDFDSADFPEFLNIFAEDNTPDDGIENIDTYRIGTFDGNARDDPRLACLLTAEGGSGQTDHVVGFFLMSFMYTIEICPVGEGEGKCPAP